MKFKITRKIIKYTDPESFRIRELTAIPDVTIKRMIQIIEETRDWNANVFSYAWSLDIERR